jgi:hypothetical protein
MAKGNQNDTTSGQKAVVTAAALASYPQVRSTFSKYLYFHLSCRGISECHNGCLALQYFRVLTFLAPMITSVILPEIAHSCELLKGAYLAQAVLDIR